MARGPSGTVLVDVDPALKDELYARITAEKKTMKSWFTERAQEYLRGQQHLPLSPASYPTSTPAVLMAADSAPSPAYGSRRSS